MKRDRAPLPWKYERWYGPNDSQEELGAAEVNCETVQEIRQNNPVVRITDKNGASVMTCHDLAIIETHDAAFIVRACNAYDELVAALEEIVDDPEPYRYSGSFDKARIVLAKAKGEA